MEHKTNAKNRTNVHLQNAIKKYGIENFDFDVLEECSKENINDRERYWISYYESNTNNGYNKTDGGDKGFIITDDIKKHMSENHADFNGDKNPAYGKVVMNDGNIVARISKDMVDEYISRGWTLGFLEKSIIIRKEGYSKYHPTRGKIEIHKESSVKYVYKEDLQQYLDKGYVRGKSEEDKKKISKANSNRIMMNNGKNNRMIKETDVQLYLDKGWAIGQYYSEESKEIHKKKCSLRNKGRTWINNGENNKFVKEDEIEKYCSNGWKIGRLYKNSKV